MNDNEYFAHKNSINALNSTINHLIGDVEDEKVIRCVTCLQAICSHLEREIDLLKEELECQKSNQN